MLEGYFSGKWRMFRYRRKVAAINALEGELQQLSERALRDRAEGVRRRASDQALDDLLVEVFALTREVSRRILGMRHYDVQLIGAMALHEGHIAEMKTGEGKTLAATPAVVLNALAGEGVHVVTVNDYLAQRDARWMGPIYRFFGLTVGVILEEMGDNVQQEIRLRHEAYHADITYGTNHEIAFDYLRDNLAVTPDEIVQRGFNFAIVDEVDFLLIDEARTPLIIGGEAEQDTALFKRVDKVVRKLERDVDFVTEPKTRSAMLTEHGFEKVERELGVDNLCDLEHRDLLHVVHQSVMAHGIFHLDVDYVVQDGELLLIDPFTGRISEDKRLSDGLHQALEAKERVRIQSQDQTIAKVTYQTFFARYRKLAGMTGTATSRRKEFRETYKREVQVVPTHAPLIRIDYADAIFDTTADKHAAVVADIARRNKAGQPVLVGTTSVRESEQLSRRLKKRGIAHQLLNAKNHAAEARIVAQAGRKGAVTISTNMAGRGTDIILGGNPAALAEHGEVGDNPDWSPLDKRKRGERTSKSIAQYEATCAAEREVVLAAGGLHVIGTEHHESQRLDDQLRGRAGRQGDPGSSHFVVSLDDKIYERFGEEAIGEIRAALAEQEHQPGKQITWPAVARTLRDLQKKVSVEDEAERKEILHYDIIVHAQREAIYAWRRRLVVEDAFDPEELLAHMVRDLLTRAPDRASLAKGFEANLHAGIDLGEGPPLSEDALEPVQRAHELLAEHEARHGREVMREAGRRIVLATIESVWTDHLTALERLEDAVGLHGYGGTEPVIAWRKEATELWRDAMRTIRARSVRQWFWIACRGSFDHVET